MAKMLSKRDSTNKHLNTARRHIRCCNQTFGKNIYTTAITPVYNQLQAKNVAYKEAIINRIDANDDTKMSDYVLDNGVCTVFEEAKRYDRDHIEGLVLRSLFPDERFGDLIKINRENEPNVIEKLVLRIENLGEQHPLYKNGAMLKGLIEKVRGSFKISYDAEREKKLAQGEVEIEKEALRKQYAKNYFDARQEMGREKANTLFPSLSTRSSSSLNSKKDVSQDHSQAA